MIDHRRFIASLHAAERRELVRRTDAPAAAALVLHAGAILATGSPIALRVPAWPLLMAVQGILIVFLLTPLQAASDGPSRAVRPGSGP